MITLKKSLLKEILLSALYFVVALIVTSLIYAFIGWFLENVIMYILDWFNSLNLWLKIFLATIVGSILSVLFNLAINLNAIICGTMNMIFPANIFTIIIGVFLSIINSIALLLQLWRTVPYWDFWFVIEFIMIGLFIISMNSMFIPRKIKYDEY